VLSREWTSIDINVEGCLLGLLLVDVDYAFVEFPNVATYINYINIFVNYCHSNTYVLSRYSRDCYLGRYLCESCISSTHYSEESSSTRLETSLRALLRGLIL
jgi:hypothetical protein